MMTYPHRRTFGLQRREEQDQKKKAAVSVAGLVSPIVTHLFALCRRTDIDRSERVRPAADGSIAGRDAFVLARTDAKYSKAGTA